MADNLTTTTTVATVPSGTKIATDEDATNGHVQIVKLAISTDGSATPLTADNTDGMLVNLGTNNDVTVTGTVTANLSATDNAVLDSIDTAVNGTLTVDGSGVTQPVSGTVTANLGATDNAVLDQIEVNTSYGDNVGNGTAVGSLRVTVASDSTGVLSVDDNGGSLTIDGTVTADLGATDNAVLDSIATATAATQAAVEGTLTVGSHAVTNAGTFATQATLQTGANVVGKVHITDGTDDATVRDVTGAKALDVSIVDASGNQITSFGGSGGTAETDDAAFTAGSGQGTPAMGFFSADTVDAGDVGVLAMDASRRLLVSIEADNAGIGGGTQYTEDAAAPANPVGNALMAERDDALAGLTPIEGDWTHLYADANGALWTAVNNTVTVDGSGVTQPVSGTVTANLSATDNAVLDAIAAAQLPDGHNVTVDNASIAITAASLPLPTGAATAAAQLPDGHNVTIDNASGASAVNIQDGGNSITVDGTVTADAGTGPWPVTDNGGALTVDWNGTAPPIGAGLEATALRVTLATDSTGVVSIDDGGGSLTVDGTITETNSAAILADTANMDTNLGTIAGAVSGTEMQVDVLTMPTVTVDLGANNDVTATGNVATDAADSGNPVKVGGKAVAFDGTVPGTAVAEADRTDFITDLYGRQYVETSHPNYFNARADYASAQTNATVQAAPGAGLKLYITDIVISNGATAGNITLLDGSGGTVIFEIYPAINGGASTNLRTPIVLTANTLLAITSTTVTTHSVMVNGYIAP